ncbi:protein Iojap, chloroplastic [Iris pallida]|uniref:Protein Iojap, chloroplastic n=1 Tax=Iris pallida TaxID=29817 RepID=A0AAX6H008_IRIPA|nr:protein Iojap, chloroplastic [Iris pallida]
MRVLTIAAAASPPLSLPSCPKIHGQMSSTSLSLPNSKRRHRCGRFTPLFCQRQPNYNVGGGEDTTDEVFDELLNKYGKVIYRSGDQKSPTAEVDDDAESLSWLDSNSPVAFSARIFHVKNCLCLRLAFCVILAIWFCVLFFGYLAVSLVWGERFPPFVPNSIYDMHVAVALAKVASDVKAGDIRVLFVKPLVYWTRFFIIVTAFSRPQIDAIGSRMRDTAEEQFKRVASGDSKPNSWTLLDFGDVVVHIFLPQQRTFYNLEEFYGNATSIELPFDSQS